MWWHTLQAGLRRPEVLLEHLDAYRELAQAEGQEWLAHQSRRALWLALAATGALGTLLTVALSLVAVAMEDPANMHAPWLLLALPAMPLLLALVSLWQWQRLSGAEAFLLTREQLAVDAQWLRQRVQP